MLRAILSRPTFVLVACQPKTASTFLTTALGNLPGARTCSLVPGYDRREQEICELRLRRYRWRRQRLLAAQHHVRFSEPTRRLIEAYSISVVVLTRNLFDAVVSIKDHVRRESIVAPMFYLELRHAALPDPELEAIIARLAIPWYLNFYMAWRDYPDALRLSYEELSRDPVAAAARVCAFAGVPQQAADLEKAMKAASGRRTRLNVGRAGRGDALSAEARAIIRNLVSIYADGEDDSYLRQHLEEDRPS